MQSPPRKWRTGQVLPLTPVRGGQKVLAVSSDPNAVSTTLDNNYVNAPVDRNRTDQFDIRVDHRFSDHLNAFGRYSFSKTNAFRPGTRPGLSEGSSNDTFGTADLKSQAVAAGLVWVIAPSLVSEARFGYAMGDYFQLPPNFGTPCPGELIGLKNAPTDPSICGGLSVFNFNGNTLRRIGRTTSQPQFQTPRSLNLRESIAWSRAPTPSASAASSSTSIPASATSAPSSANSTSPAVSQASTACGRTPSRTSSSATPPATSRTPTPLSTSTSACTSPSSRTIGRSAAALPSTSAFATNSRRRRASATSSGRTSTRHPCLRRGQNRVVAR